MPPTLLCSGNLRDGFNDQLDNILESAGDYLGDCVGEAGLRTCLLGSS